MPYGKIWTIFMHTGVLRDVVNIISDETEQAPFTVDPLSLYIVLNLVEMKIGSFSYIQKKKCLLTFLLYNKAFFFSAFK